MRHLVVAALAALVLTACPGDPSHRQPVAGDDGLTVSGRLAGRHVAVSDGEPEVVYGRCTRGQTTVQLCIAGSTIDGETLGLIIDNPEVLTAGEILPVRADCPPPCADAVVVSVGHGADRLPVTGGRLTVAEAGPRYRAGFVLRRPDNTVLTGTFNVRPPATP